MDVVHKLDNGLDSIFPIPTSVRSNSVAVNTEEGHTVLPQQTLSPSQAEPPTHPGKDERFSSPVPVSEVSETAIRSHG